MKKLLKSTVARGYGAAHTTERQRWQERIDRGELIQCACRRAECEHHDQAACPTIINLESKWDLGHTDDRTDWTGPECVPCNRSAGARNSRVSQANPMTIRAWCEPNG